MFTYIIKKAQGTHITTLRTKEMSSMPLSTTSNHDFPLNRCLATLTPRTKELMVIQMTIKAQPFIAIFLFRPRHIIISRHPIANPVHAIKTARFRFGVESNTFEPFATVMAAKAFGMETYACCGDDTASDR
jgi:hypothetical protein